MIQKLLTALFILSALPATAQKPYKDSVDEWHRQRTESLKKEDGWLNLAGLFWLQPGKNNFGSSKNVPVQFPAAGLAPVAGYFELKDSVVTLHTNAGVLVKVNGHVKNDTIIFNSRAAKLAVCSYGSLRWTIIKREEKIGIRLRNLNSKLLKQFKGIRRFPVNSSYRVSAVLQPGAGASTISITNVLGQTSALRSPGKLLFTLGGKEYSLDALEEGDELFIIFADATSGNDTYPTGRFLYAANPGAGGTTILDFNKAYNPPCAFTPYATCPLPPKQNVLPVAITAGEKNYAHH